MTLQEIKDAVEAGKTVHWASEAYIVVKDDIGQWMVHCPSTKAYWGLYRRDGTLTDKESKFFIAKPTGLLRLWLYRTKNSDVEGDPIEHGVIRARTIEEVREHLQRHFVELGFDWDLLEHVWVYECKDADAEGDLKFYRRFALHVPKEALV